MNELAGIYFHKNEDKEFEKYMVGGIFNEPNKHLTLRLWHEKQELDLHITNESLPKGHPDRYYTIFRISFDKLTQLGKELETLDWKAMLPELKKMNAGRLTRWNSYLQLLTGDLSDLKRKMFKFKGSKKNKGRFRKELPLDEIHKHIFLPNELKKIEDGAFLIWRVKKGKAIMNGYAFRSPIHKDSNKFIFMSKKSMQQFQRKVVFFFYDKIQLLDFDNKDYVISEFEKALRKYFPLDVRFKSQPAAHETPLLLP